MVEHARGLAVVGIARLPIGWAIAREGRGLVFFYPGEGQKVVRGVNVARFLNPSAAGIFPTLCREGASPCGHSFGRYSAGNLRGPLQDNGQPTRARNSPVRVSTFTLSPGLRYSGTWITRPVSSLAGLFREVADPPRTAGVHSTIRSSTATGI